jgi:hypothetical protein
VKYVVAGYVLAMAVLALYAVTLVVRRRSLERAAALRGDVPEAQPGTEPDGGP